MLAKKCDKCGSFYEHYDGSRVFKEGEKSNAIMLIDRDLEHKYWGRETYDFCPECMAKIQEFIKDKEN